MAKKNTTGDYRKHFHNDYKTGRLSYEDPLTQWAHIMVLDEMFELQKRNECLLYKHAVKRYGKKEVDKLIEESFFLKKKSNFNNEECIYCEQIDNNIIEITDLSNKKRQAANVRHHGNKEGKTDPVKELEKKQAEQELERIKRQEAENEKVRKQIEEAQKHSTTPNPHSKNKDPYMGTEFIT
jgi:hypothetical protein